MPQQVWADRARRWSRPHWVVLGVVLLAGAVALRFVDARGDGPELGVGLAQLLLVLGAVVLLGRRLFARGFSATTREVAVTPSSRPSGRARTARQPKALRRRALASTAVFVVLDVALLVGAAVRRSYPLLALGIVVAPLAIMGLGGVVAMTQARRRQP
ncbi:hypothetical protein [Angustibacter aerolatus]